MNRQDAFLTASALVKPVVDEHGLEDFPSGVLFNPYTSTKVDQHIDHILKVAEWLIEGEYS